MRCWEWSPACLFRKIAPERATACFVPGFLFRGRPDAAAARLPWNLKFDSEIFANLLGRDSQQRSFRCRRTIHFLFFLAPEVKGVSKHDVSEQIMLRIVADVERRIELKIARQITGEPDC
jgi:hypothetical protein